LLVLVLLLMLLLRLHAAERGVMADPAVIGRWPASSVHVRMAAATMAIQMAIWVHAGRIWALE